MRKLFYFLLVLITSLSISSCGSSPDHSENSVKIFLEENYFTPEEIIPIYTRFPSAGSPYVRLLQQDRSEAQDILTEFDYIAIVKNSDGGKKLLLIRSEGAELKIVFNKNID